MSGECHWRINHHNQTARLQQTAAKPEIDKSKREMSALKEKGAPNDGGLSKTINTKNKEKFEKLKTDSSVTKLYQL